MSSFVISLIRTVVPLLVGAVVGWLASVGIPVDLEAKAELVASLSLLSGSLYYMGVNALAARVPVFGWLLGVAAKPVYSLEQAKTQLAEKPSNPYDYTLASKPE